MKYELRSQNKTHNSYLLFLISVLVFIVLAFFAGFFINQGSICKASGIESATVSPSEFSRRLSVCNSVILDVRTAEEFASGHLTGSQNIDFNQNEKFSHQLDNMDKNATYFIYCRTGKRSAAASKLMADKGFRSVINLDGGITAWTSAGLPVSK